MLDLGADLDGSDAATYAKEESFHFESLPWVQPSKQRQLMDHTIFSSDSGTMTQQQQQAMASVLAAFDTSEDPCVLALTQLVPDVLVYAAMLSGNKAELSWRVSGQWKAVTQLAVILRSDADIQEAQAKPPLPKQYSLPASLTVEIAQPSSLGSSQTSTAFQLLIDVVDNAPDKVRNNALLQVAADLDVLGI